MLVVRHLNYPFRILIFANITSFICKRFQFFDSHRFNGSNSSMKIVRLHFDTIIYLARLVVWWSMIGEQNARVLSNINLSVCFFISFSREEGLWPRVKKHTNRLVNVTHVNENKNKTDQMLCKRMMTLKKSYSWCGFVPKIQKHKKQWQGVYDDAIA